MLGSSLGKVFPDAIGFSRSDFDATNYQALLEYITAAVKKNNISTVINCLAYNNVDGAETYQHEAWTINAELPGEIAKICESLGLPLVHFSTNYVFDGRQELYDESSSPHPLSYYGQTKYAGELAVRQYARQSYIIRTSVLFGRLGSSSSSKKSFVDLMLDLSQKNATIKAVNDEVNSITFVDDLARFTTLVITTLPAFGIYHGVNAGHGSWFDLAQEIFTITNKKVTLVPVPAREFVRAAVRPQRAVLSNTKLPPLRPWQEALREFL